MIVGSSNFDRRFNAGRLFSFSVTALADLVPPASTDVFFRNDFGDAIIDSVRVDSFSGELAVVNLTTVGDAPSPHVLSPSRFNNELAVVRVAPDGSLSCELEGSPRETGFDCTDSHRVGLLARDAYRVTVAELVTSSTTTVEQKDRQQVIAVGSLSALFFGGVPQGTMSFMTSDYLEQRLTGALQPVSADENCNVNDLPLVTVRGIGGIVPLIPTPVDTASAAEMLSLSFNSASPTLALVRHRITTELEPGDCPDPEAENIDIVPTQEVRLDAELSAFQGRGLVSSGDGTRAYATVRFPDARDTFNSAVVVVDVTTDPVRLISAVEVGEELGRPSLDERPDGARLLYVGDMRTDQIYVLNVITDQPVVTARIEGRGLRDFDGDVRQVRLLDQPAETVFVQDGDRRLAFVSNFTNSTIGVIDVTDTDPRRHRVIARLGRDLDPQGESEGP